MKLISHYKIVKDFRGVFMGILNSGHWEEFNYIETFAGEVRGNHYHIETKELFFILDGEVEIQISSVENVISDIFIARKGTLFIIDPFERHVFKCLKDSKWINVLEKKMNDEFPDLYR